MQFLFYKQKRNMENFSWLLFSQRCCVSPTDFKANFICIYSVYMFFHGFYRIGKLSFPSPNSWQIAWALNKGVKTEYKQFWDVDLGVTYIPWEKVKVDDLEGFAEGGMIDQETVNTGTNPNGGFITYKAHSSDCDC